MIFYPTERLAILIDGANTHGASRALQFDIDYKAVLTLFSKKGVLVRAHYYTLLLTAEDGFSPVKSLVDWLGFNGYTVRTKPAKESIDAFGNKRIRGSIEVDLTCDALGMADHIDHFILWTGDSAYRALVKSLQRKGKRVSIVSTTNPSMIADDFRRLADNFIDLAELMPTIARKERVLEKVA